jgi:hypothetical protein
MTSGMTRLATLAAVVLFSAPILGAEKAGTASEGGEKYRLRYKFQPGEELRWTVVHRCRIRTAVSETVQEVETTTTSMKLWRVKAMRPEGATEFEHLVEWVDMRHKLAGSDEVHYDSRRTPVAPLGFEDVARAVGVPLGVVTMGADGKVLQHRRNSLKAAVAREGEMTVRMPEEPVAVGHQWSFPYDIDVPLPGGAGTRRVKALQKFTLEDVKTGVASIRVATQILTPVRDPALESQLVQYESSGIVRFDIDAGRMLSQQLDVDKGVVGFRGEASSIRYASRFTEEFLPAGPKVAAR